MTGPTSTNVSLRPHPKFNGVARSIAKGNPPKWLLVGLTHFSGGIGDGVSKKDRRSIDNIVRQMQDAVHTLMTRLPAWGELGYGQECPEYVALMLYALPRMKKDLDSHAKKRKGRRPNTQQEICAAVVIEAWKLLHGKAEPQGLRLQQACGDYWRACGGKQIGGWDEPKNSRRPIERALAVDHWWISQILLALVQNEH
jgi:hypothetical protein